MKILEKLIGGWLCDHLEKKNFSDLQHGFRSSRSALDLWIVVSNRIAGAFNRAQTTLAVALEICKAFDKVWHAGHS